MSKHIAIFGGAFDPPHLGHALLIAQIINCVGIDEVWIVPSGKRVDKMNEGSELHRLSMANSFIEELFKGDSRIKVIPDQCNGLLKSSFTYDLLAHFRIREPHARFSIVIGSELLDDIPKWYNGEWLLAHASFLVVVRGGVENRQPPNGMKHVAWIPNPLELVSSLSSTAVRALVKDGKSIQGLVSPSVERFIMERKLYT